MLGYANFAHFCRNKMDDFTGSALAEAEEREKHPTFVAPFALNSHGEWVQTCKGVSYARNWFNNLGVTCKYFWASCKHFLVTLFLTTFKF
jgi:hypothetical protein